MIDLIGANGATLVAAIPKRALRAAVGLNWLKLRGGEERLADEVAFPDWDALVNAVRMTPIPVIFAVENSAMTSRSLRLGRAVTATGTPLRLEE